MSALNLLSDPHAWASLATLTVLEIVLGIDNIVFLSIASHRLAPESRPAARRIGLSLALIMRIALLTSIAAIIGLSRPVVTLWGEAFSWRDIVFAAGGLFLLTKGTREIHGMVEGEEDEHRQGGHASFAGVIVQIALFDLVFSIDSVVTAVGMAEHLTVMIAAVVLAMIVMLAASGPVSEFVHRNPTVKMLALSFLLLIGMSLVADAMHVHIPRGYLYFAIAFSGIVEALNRLAARRRRKNQTAPPRRA
ncbi:MAG: TerC family protein [Alphaproteobacteria bacterium]|nr:TerC family protein [Alphaproteobacteria bacterium]